MKYVIPIVFGFGTVFLLARMCSPDRKEVVFKVKDLGIFCVNDGCMYRYTSPEFQKKEKKGESAPRKARARGP